MKTKNIFKTLIILFVLSLSFSCSKNTPYEEYEDCEQELCCVIHDAIVGRRIVGQRKDNYDFYYITFESKCKARVKIVAPDGYVLVDYKHLPYKFIETEMKYIIQYDGYEIFGELYADCKHDKLLGTLEIDNQIIYMKE